MRTPCCHDVATAQEEDVQCIVGESLRDFLSFGLRTGYFSVYGDTRWSNEIEWKFPTLDESRQTVLNLLSHALNLTPWPAEEYPARLEDLQRRFLHLVEWSEE